MATFDVADTATREQLADVLEKYHPDLVEAGVTVAVLMAYAAKDERTGVAKGPALKHANFPAAALVRVNQLRDRVEGKDDATILLCGDSWATRSEEEQLAILDHELTHLEVQRDKDGAIKIDDCGRPKLKIRPHDAQMGVFYEVVKRHKSQAIESQSYAELHKQFTQLCFPWG